MKRGSAKVQVLTVVSNYFCKHPEKLLITAKQLLHILVYALALKDRLKKPFRKGPQKDTAPRYPHACSHT